MAKDTRTDNQRKVDEANQERKEADKVRDGRNLLKHEPSKGQDKK